MHRIAVLLLLVLGCHSEPPPPQPRPGLLDHTPHHGGIVFSGPRQAVEAAAAPDGTVRVWLGDGWRQPIPLDGMQGTLTVLEDGGPRPVALVHEGDALVAHAGPLRGERVPVLVELLKDGNPMLRASFVLPVAPGTFGAAGVPLEGCVPPPDEGEGPRPRCVLHFVQGVTGVAANRAGDAMILSVLETPTSSWRLPGVTLLAGFQPPPAEQLDTDQAPHVDEPVSMTTSPDGREVILALGERLLRHDIVTGRLLSELAAGHPAPRSVAWAPDGRTVLVTRFSGHTLDVLDAHDGTPVRSIPIDADVATTTVAVSADGSRAAVGTEAGPVVVVPLRGDGALTRLSQPVQPSDALGFAGDVLVAAGGEGVLRVWDVATGALRVAVPIGAPVMRLAVNADGTRVATADRTGTIRVHAMPDASLERAMGWHRAQVRGMAWAGTLLLAGDADRQLAVWDLAR